MTTEKIKLSNVSKVYNAHSIKAVQNVNLNIHTGEMIALMGQSGCGKSTLLNLIGGIDRPSAGQLFVDNQDISLLSDQDLTKLRQTKIGFIFQFFNLLNTLTVLENVLLPLQLSGQTLKQSKEQTEDILEQVGMVSRKNFYPSQLSGGQMQRVAIARALIHQPDIILADEPTGNLDSENGEQVMALLVQLSKTNQTTMIMATHSLEIAKYAQRTLMMKDGQFIN